MARSFNGTSDNISIAHSAFVNPTSSSFTISCWFFVSSLPAAGSYATVFNQTGASRSNYFVGLAGATQTKASYFANGNVSGLDPGTNAYLVGAWNHVVFVYDTAAGISAFLNNVADGTFSGAGSVTWGTNVTSLGENVTGSSNFLKANIADWAIWNTTLNGTQISQLFNGVRPTNVSSANLQAWLPLDGYASPETDASGNGNTGTLTGTSQALGPPALWRISG